MYLLVENQFAVGKFFEVNAHKIITNQNIPPKRLYVLAWRSVKNQYIDPKMNGQDWDRWKKRYLPYIKTNEDVYIAVNTMLQSLDDPYSKFMNIPQYQNQNITIDAKVTGIGITLMSVSNKVVISNIIEGSPAQKAGLQEGDIIAKINGANLERMPIENIVKLIRGKAHSKVQVDIIRNNKKLSKVIERNIVHIKSVHGDIIKDNIGYIRIDSFMGINVPNEFKTELIKTKNTKGLIIDVRSDAGGLLNNAVIMANMIINEGNIVSIVYRNGQKIDMQAQRTAFYPAKPIVVLINRGTASSSEILTGALRDEYNAILIGDTTYGKNTIQKIIPLPNQTGMNLTVAKYLMPNGEDIHKKGIKPDIKVLYTANDYVNNYDSQLDIATQILKQIIVKNNKLYIAQSIK